MKKLFLFIIAALFVFSCGGGKGSDESEAPDCCENDFDEISDDSSDPTDPAHHDDSNDPSDPNDSDDPANFDDSDEEPDVETDDSDRDTDTVPDEDTPEAVDTSKVEWNGKIGTVAVSGGELRTYTLTTNAELRDNYPESKQRTVSETAESPVLRSGNNMLDALFALAITELNENKVTEIRDGSMNGGNPLDCDCFETGANWHYVWTRDTAYAVHSAVAFFEPQKSKNSLKFKISERKSAVGGGNMQIVQDTGSGGSWPVSTDRVVWALGAIETLKNLEGNDYNNFLSDSYEAIKNTLEADRLYVYDEKDGLYRGEQSFLDWREQTYPKWTADNTKHIGMSKTLSTNVLHYMAMNIAASMAEELGKTNDAAQFLSQAENLKNAIKSSFYLKDRKTFSTMKTTFLDYSAVDKMDLLGEALTILSGVSDDTQNAEIIAGYPVTEAGPAVIFPQEPDTKIYHNRAIWPFVTSYALRAAAKAGNDKFFENAFMSLVRGAAFNLSNMENFEFTTLNAWYDDATFPNLSGPEVNSRRQLWSVAGFLSMVLDSVFGREQTLKTLWFSPKIPVNLRNTFFAGSSEIVLKNLKFKGKTLELKIVLPQKNSKNSGFYTLKTLKLDGLEKTEPFSISDLKAESRIEMELELSEETGSLNLVDCNSDPEKCWAPLPATNVSVGLDGKRLGITFAASGNAVSYNIYRDGKKVKENLTELSWRDDYENPDYVHNSYCYSISAVNSKGWESHHSDPVCYWGENYERTKLQFSAVSSENAANEYRFDQFATHFDHNKPHFGDWGLPEAVLSVSGIKPKDSGTYLVSVEYGSGRPINTGITSCNKIAKITDENNNVVLEKMVFMPHLGDNWDIWGESSFVSVELSAGKTYKAEISDAFNMSYFEHFVPYYVDYCGMTGGGPNVYNRANISTLKFLLKEIKN